MILCKRKEIPNVNRTNENLYPNRRMVLSPSCTHKFSCRECKDSCEQNKASDDATHGDGRAVREHSEESGGDHAAAVLECADECRRRTRDLIRNFGERRRIGTRGNNAAPRLSAERFSCGSVSGRKCTEKKSSAPIASGMRRPM